MKVGGFKPLTRSDVPDAPEWLEKAFGPVNSQVKALTDAANASLSPADNFNAEVKDVSAGHLEVLQIRLSTLKGAPAFVFASSARGFVVPQLRLLEEKLAEVTLFFVGTQPTEPVPVRLWFQGR